MLDSLLNLLKDSFPQSDNKSVKLWNLIFIILLIIIFDSLYGFSQLYFNQQKIEQLTTISKELREANIDVATKNGLTELRNQVLSQTHIYEKIWSLIPNFNANEEHDWLNSGYYLFLFAGPLLVTIVSIFLILYSLRSKDFWKIVGGVTIVMVVAWGFSIVIKLVLDLFIPYTTLGTWVKVVLLVLLHVLFIRAMIKSRNQGEVASTI